MPDFDPRRIVLALVDHGVDFVVIGASAATLQGVPLPATLDLDVSAATSKANLQRLAAALKELEAALRVPGPEGSVPAPMDERMLANLSVATLMTRFGPLDVLFEPAGAPSYPELREGSVEVRVYGVVIQAAALQDIVSMKRAAGREKDAAHLVVLSEYLRELASGD